MKAGLHLSAILKTTPKSIDLIRLERLADILYFEHFLLHFQTKRIPASLFAQASRISDLDIRLQKHFIYSKIWRLPLQSGPIGFKEGNRNTKNHLRTKSVTIPDQLLLSNLPSPMSALGLKSPHPSKSPTKQNSLTLRDTNNKPDMEHLFLNCTEEEVEAFLLLPSFR